MLDVHPWVGTWMHNEFLDLGGEKISKSKGHVLVVDTLVERGLDPLAFRYFFLQAHYRQQQAFTWEAMEAAATALRRLVGHAVAARDAGGDARRRRASSRTCAASGPRWPTTSTRPRRWPPCGTRCATQVGVQETSSLSKTTLSLCLAIPMLQKAISQGVCQWCIFGATGATGSAACNS